MGDTQNDYRADAAGWLPPITTVGAIGAEPVLTATRPADSVPADRNGAAELIAARGRLEATETYAALAELFGALADPTRARIVHLLMQREWTTSQIAAITGATEPATSQHLRVLRDLHLVRSRRAGRWVYYRLDDLHVTQLMRTSLAHLRDGRAHDSLSIMEEK